MRFEFCRFWRLAAEVALTDGSALSEGGVDPDLSLVLLAARVLRRSFELFIGLFPLISTLEAGFRARGCATPSTATGPFALFMAVNLQRATALICEVIAISE
jgi:hypothetical protein